MPTNSESTTLYHMGIIKSMKIIKSPTVYIYIAMSLLILAFSWKNKIIFTDEIIYEDIAFTMYKTKDFLTPRLHGQVWLEKTSALSLAHCNNLLRFTTHSLNAPLGDNFLSNRNTCSYLLPCSHLLPKTHRNTCAHSAHNHAIISLLHQNCKP